ncbi:Developmentally regulated GTP-binding protein [Spraguea lophii 42_110]|uniref:Developmentally regulated GTP-binding protein n=1 Tax=Spraguea lophii (strain 42_110) TaxID=1358809 RepID=S7W6B1_SPRLO|nr:Developmentally regulated GTP-binding protein [Spraguea lophii 42_110]
MGLPERIAEIELELARTQKNKATEHHIGSLKARLAKLKLEQSNNTSSTGQKHATFEVKKSGDARISLIGFPSVGKSTLLTKLTNSDSAIAAHEFTTLTCIPGKLEYNDTTIQILDLPGIIPGASKGRGRGRQVIGVARTSDMILIVLDPRKKEQKRLLLEELEAMDIRINKKKKNISLIPTKSGGISIIRAYDKNINERNANNDIGILTDTTITMILKEYKMNNCILTLKELISTDDLIDHITNRAVYIKALFVYNKIDTLDIETIDKLSLNDHSVVISSNNDWNLDELLYEVWNGLKLTRIYTKKKGDFPDLDKPVVLKNNSGKCRVEDLCVNLHKDFVVNFKYAMVWGNSVKYNPQKVGLNHILEDEDVVQIYV